MTGRFKENLSFFAAVTAVITLTAAVILFAVTLGNGRLDFERTFYFICYSKEDDAYSAAAISDTVANYGGAGYTVEYGGEYYVTVACYYSQRNAETVRQSIMRRGLQCFVLKAETDGYPLGSSGRGKEKLYSGNLETLYSLSEMCYNCANGLDTGQISQSAASGIIADVKSALKGLQSSNRENCFTSELKRLYTECQSAEEGYIYSKSMRKLQIAIIDCILNIKLY